MLWLERRGVDEAVERANGTQVREEFEVLTQPEKGLFRYDLCVPALMSRQTADGTEQNGVAARTGGKCGLGDGHPLLGDSGETGETAMDGEVVLIEVRNSQQHLE